MAVCVVLEKVPALQTGWDVIWMKNWALDLYEWGLSVSFLVQVENGSVPFTITLVH